MALSLVNGIELFDFTVFGFFASAIGEQFFPAKDAMTSLLFATGTFGVGFVARLVGAMWIGAWADRHGRRPAWLATCWLAGAGTLAMVVCPPYAAIGVLAPLIVVAARVLQGLAIGGEQGTGSALLMELAPSSRLGRAMGWLYAGNGLAILLGALLGALLSHVLSPAQLSAWGWRVAFAMGLPLIAVGYFLRTQWLGRSEFHPVARAARTREPLAELLREHGGTLAIGTLLMGFRTVPLYAVVTYMPTYVDSVLHRHMVTGFLASVVSAALLVVLSPLSGSLMDRLPRLKPALLALVAATALMIFPVCFVIAHVPTPIALLAGVACIAAVLPPGSCAASMLVLEAFPPSVRATGQGTAYALGTALFGSTAQLIATALIKWTGNPMAIAWYVALCCLLSFGALLPLRDARSRG